METTPILSWTLVSECAIPGDIQALLVQGERGLTPGGGHAVGFTRRWPA